MRGDRRHPLTRILLVAGILIVALGLRVAYVESTSYKAVNDAGTYNRFASTIAQHGDYITGDGPGTGTGGSRGPTAYFPPAFPYALAVVDLIDGHSSGGRTALHGERIANAVFSTAGVALLGLVALEAFGAPVGLAALALGAIYPVSIELSGTIVAENLLIVFELAAVWTALRARRASGLRAGRAWTPWGWVAATGVLTGLGTLAHENAIFTLIPLAVALAAAVGGRAPRRLAAVGLLAATTAAMIVPWTIRNAVELHHFVPVSDETGVTLRGAYNPASAAFAPLPYKWRFFWQIPSDHDVRAHAGRYTEVQLSDVLQHRAMHYISDHPSAPLSAGWHNVARMFELEGSYAWHASAAAIGLHVGTARVGVISFWVLCALAIAGLFTRAVRAGPKWIWAIPVLYALTVVFFNVETPRFRAPIDPFIVLLAACAVAAAFERLRTSRP